MPVYRKVAKEYAIENNISESQVIQGIKNGSLDGVEENGYYFVRISPDEPEERASGPPLGVSAHKAVDKSTVDKQIAALGDFDRYFTKKERNYLHKVLSPGERIHAMTSGMLDGSTWLITVTSNRVLFLDKGIFYGLKQLEILIPQISTVSHKTGMMFGEIEVTASGDSKKIEMIEKKDVPKVADIISSLMRENKDSSTSKSTHDTRKDNDVVSRLERLAALKERGILDELEFKEQKAKILAE